MSTPWKIRTKIYHLNSRNCSDLLANIIKPVFEEMLQYKYQKESNILTIIQCADGYRNKYFLRTKQLFAI